jgi:hypothetical protein
VANIPVLALQGGVANGSEQTFDGQPMQPGVHLHWSFLAALGFPPGGFWLCRRAAKPDDERIPPPPCVDQLQTTVAPPSGITSAPPSPTRTVTGTTVGNQWLATLPAPCQSVTLAGCAAPGCDEVIIETFSRDANGDLQVSGRRAVQVEKGAFRVSVQASKISCVRVVGAGNVDECACEPPKDCGGGNGGGGNGGGGCNPGCGKPVWCPPNGDGWQCWGVPFTLPVTVANWPARYFGAPDPNTTPASVVEQKDIQESRRRLGALHLAAGMTAAQEQAALTGLRAELVRLVLGFPSTLLADVSIPDPPAGANAPNLSINLMQQLLLLALDPYFARVLGLYFVDGQVAPGVRYDYSITGFWGKTLCQTSVIFPGLAPGAPLARGSATFGGITIQPLDGSTSLWRWTKFDINGNYLPRLDPSAPPVAQTAVSGSLSGLTQAQQPEALLIATSKVVGFPFFTPPPQVSIALSQPVPRVDVQVSGTGAVLGLSGGTVVSTANFGSSQLTTVTVNAANPGQLIDQIQVNGVALISILGTALTVGALTLHPLSPDAIGTRYAIIPPPVAIQPITAPGQPFSTFRHRQADIDTTKLTLVTHSLIDVEWPAPPVTAAQQTGDPVTDPLALPPPTQPIGFVAEREDVGVAGSAKRIPGWIGTRSAPKPKGSQVTTANLYRLADSQLLDPVGGWSHRVAAFDLFGALGNWSNWSAPRKVEKIAAAPTAMRIMQFDNSSAGGGAAAANGSSWIGGTLNLIVNWSGAAFMMYPDIVTARITVESIDSTGAVTGQLSTKDLTVPAPSIQALTVVSVVSTLSADGSTYIVDIQTNPALTALGIFDPGQVLMLTLPDGASGPYTERYAVRPSNPLSPAPGPVVARLTAGSSARVVSTTNDFLGQPAYLVCGYGAQPLIKVPLVVPIAQQSARAQASVIGSTQNPFLANEQIIDPNGINPARPEPQSVKLIFNGPQRLVPPTPPTPVHVVDHVYYDPADATGLASKTLPFTTPAGAGISGYVLARAPVRSLAIADIKRRIALANLADNNPVVIDGGQPRPDLVAWIASLAQWLAGYNAVAGTSWTVANALEDTAAQRAFIEHFYGGLLDDELRALADLAANAAGYARVNPQPFAPGGPISDSVDGTGFGRTLYRLAAVNQAGSISSSTGSIGPYYTQIVTPPRPPVLYKVQATESAVIVAWALDTNPDVAAYLVYRGATLDALADLRYFGADWTHPVPASELPSIKYNEKSYPPLSFVQGTPPNIDKRIIGFVPDPRLCARDYNGSDMGEIALPPGPPPDAVNGVFRLSDYNSVLDPLHQLVFNYWTPPAVGGIAQLKTDSPTQSRLTGLRIGLGRGVPVVVVATWKGNVKVIGQVPVRRAGFVDGVTAGGAPLDPNAIPAAPAPSTTMLNAYVVVAVDIFGNRSVPSKAFAAQMLAKV